MGFRTVVVLNNDRSHEWEKDPELGQKIFVSGASSGRLNFEYGQVIEQVHADTQTLAVLDGYGGDVMSRTHWFREQATAERDLELLKNLAKSMGYRLVRATKKPATG